MADKDQITSTPDEVVETPAGDEGATEAVKAEVESEPVKIAKKPAKKTKAGPKSHQAEEPVTATPGKVGTPKLPHGKKYRAAIVKVDAVKLYTLDEALALAKETTITKFDSAVELHVRVAQEARGAINYPHSTGKKVRVAVAGAEVYEELAKGKINFDVLIAAPSEMPNLAKYARSLGPKGLMPNPKSGTVTEDIEKVKAELESGRTEYRTDAGKNIHLVVGRVSQPVEELKANAEAALSALVSWNVHGAVMATTMGPGMKLQLEEK